jgi:hypothetical protein
MSGGKRLLALLFLLCRPWMFGITVMELKT